MDIKKTANSLIIFTAKRLAEIFGLVILVLGLFLFIALFSYSPEDPNFIFPDNTEIKNLLGFNGSFISDLFYQSIGLMSYLFSVTLIFTGINILRIKDFFLIIENIFFSIIYLIFGTLFFTHFFSNGFALYINGNGGFIGVYLNQTFLNSLISINETISFYLLIVFILILFLISINFHPIKFYKTIKKTLDLFKKKEKN